MPELPEVEVLVRHLRPRLRNKIIRNVRVPRARTIAPLSALKLAQVLRGAKFTNISRRGKYLLFALRASKPPRRLLLIGHLGMTGRMYVLPAAAPLPKHVAAVFNLGRENFVFEDTRFFGRLTLDGDVLSEMGPEPLEAEFSVEGFTHALCRSAQPIKVKLLDQSVVAGVGNIYASEALFRAGISPTLPARRLNRDQISRLRRAIRQVLAQAIAGGSTVPLDYSGVGELDGLFYFGRAPGAPDYYEERLKVYDRAGRPCPKCGTPIKRLVQAARSTFYCPRCQRG